MKRDFTYIDDIVAGIIGVLGNKPSGTPPYKIYNLGNNCSENLMDFINILEKAIGKKAIVEPKPLQPGDAKETYADITEAQRDFGFSPKTSIKEGLPKFVEWYKSYYL
jgi:UDP-glucuronate 4-epimerase